MPLVVPDDVLVEAAAYYRKLARQPRLNFASRRQVVLLRLIMRLVGMVSRPLRGTGLRAVRRVVEYENHQVPVRIIAPTGRPKALVVDIHGGAWTIMRAINDDPLTGPMAAENFVAVSVDYRLAPEQPFADVITDCAAALAWALSVGARHYGVDHVFLHGDSAGAHLCLMAALACRSLPDFERLRGMVLFFGAYDLSGTPSVRNAPADTLALYGPTLAAFFSTITGRVTSEALRHPDVSPLYADLRALPSSLILVGTADPLLDDSLLLAARLAEQGSECELAVVPDAPHAFNRLPLRLAALTNAYARAWMGARTAPTV